MAIVRATSNTRIRADAKKTIRYIEHRRGKDGEKINRPLFGVDGVMTRKHAYRFIDEAPKGSIFCRLVINPDPKREDTRRDLHLREITAHTMLTLSNHLNTKIAWVAAEHADHSPKRHVHILAVIPRRLTPVDFEILRAQATEIALSQRKERDLMLGIGQGRGKRRFVTHPTSRTRGVSRHFGYLPPLTTYRACPRCGGQNLKPKYTPSYWQGAQTMMSKSTCVSCGYRFSRRNRPSLTLRKEYKKEEAA